MADPKVSILETTRAAIQCATAALQRSNTEKDEALAAKIMAALRSKKLIHADEEVHAACRGIVHRCEHLCRIERDLAEVEQPDLGGLLGGRW